MKAKLIFFKKTVLFILSMLCFYFGARAQQYRLKEFQFTGRNNNIWANISKETYNYTNSNLPFDLATETIRYQPDQANNNNWLTINKKINNYSTTSPFPLQEESEFTFQNGQYATQANYRTLYNYNNVGINFQEVRLSQNFANSAWTDAYRETLIKNPQGKTVYFSQESHNGATFFPTFEVSITYNANNEQLETTRILYNGSNGAFIESEKIQILMLEDF